MTLLREEKSKEGLGKLKDLDCRGLRKCFPEEGHVTWALEDESEFARRVRSLSQQRGHHQKVACRKSPLPIFIQICHQTVFVKFMFTAVPHQPSVTERAGISGSGVRILC